MCNFGTKCSFLSRKKSPEISFKKGYISEENLFVRTHFQSSSPGSTEERTVLEKAEEYGCKRDKSELPAADVDLILPTLEVSVGDDFEMSLEFVNRSDELRTVDIYISGSVVFYTGVTNSEFLFRNPTVTIGPNKSEIWVSFISHQQKKTRTKKYFPFLIKWQQLQYKEYLNSITF